MARLPVFERLPKIWHRLDQEGVLERYLKSWDVELDAVHDKITELLSIRNLDVIPERYLQLLADLIGHRWRSDKTREWNRNRMRDSIRRYSYKGTITQLNDLAKEHGGTGADVTDMASKLLVLGKNGRLGCTDAAIVSSDYYHDGAFDVQLDRRMDYDEFMADLAHTKPSAEVWFFSLAYYLKVVMEEAWSISRNSRHDSTNAFFGSVGFGTLGKTLFVAVDPNREAVREHGGVDWRYCMPSIGFGAIGIDLWLSTEPVCDAWCQSYPVGWHPSGNTQLGTLGKSPLGKDYE